MARPPLTAVPAQRSSTPALAVRRRIVIGLLCGAAGIGVLSGLAWLTDTDPPPVQVAARDEAAVALAEVVVADLVAGRNTAVPAAEGVSTEFSKQGEGVFAGAQVAFAGSVQERHGDAVSMTTERVQFYVSVPGQDMYLVSVPMALTASGWVLGAAPSVEPAGLSEPAKVPDYSALYTEAGTAADLARLPFGDAVVEQVNRWAHAYASGGKASPELFAITGDDDSSRTYDGLGGWSVESARITSYMQGPNSASSAAEFGDTWLVVRVALVLAPPAANGPTLSAEYDLLLQPLKNQAQPPVTAWGPAGSGPYRLKNYLNSNG